MAITLDGRGHRGQGPRGHSCHARAAHGSRPHRAAQRRRARRGARGRRHGGHPPGSRASTRRRRREGIEQVAAAIAAARRPIVILGLDLDPRSDVAAVRAFVEAMGAPTFVTPKAKGMLPEDHPLFYGVCAGVAGDRVVLDLFERADLLVGDRVRARRVRQALAPHDAARLHRPGVDRLGVVPSARGGGRRRAGDPGRARPPPARAALAWEPDTAARFRAASSSASSGRRRGREASPATS